MSIRTSPLMPVEWTEDEQIAVHSSCKNSGSISDSWKTLIHKSIGSFCISIQCFIAQVAGGPEGSPKFCIGTLKIT